MGGKMPTSCIGSAILLPPAIPTDILPIAFSTTLLPAVEATTFKASMILTPAFKSVPSVREKPAVEDFICRSPIFGTFSRNLSKANCAAGIFITSFQAIINATNIKKRKPPLFKRKSEMRITTCVGAGSSAFRASNCSANVGTTNVIRAITTNIPTMITITG